MPGENSGPGSTAISAVMADMASYIPQSTTFTAPGAAPDVVPTSTGTSVYTAAGAYGSAQSAAMADKNSYIAPGQTAAVDTPAPPPIVDKNGKLIVPLVPPTKTIQQAIDDILAGTMTAYGMSGVASTIAQIRKDYPDATSDQLLMLLKNDTRYNAEYNKRFAGNAALKAQGLQPLDDATYLKSEQEYAKVLKGYGLDTLATRDQYATFIGNSMDLQDVTDRISLAIDHLKANPDANAAFDKFYPTLSTGDKLALMLKPETQLPIMKKKVQAAEIGGAALAQHLETNLTDITSMGTTGYSNVSGGTLGAEALQNAGVTTAAAKAGYQQIAQDLPAANKLSAIYAGTLDQYGQKQAEQEQLLGLASATRAKQALSQKEQATWSGQTGQLQSAYGVNRTAFGTSAQGSI